jgi:four helix bundle protein
LNFAETQGAVSQRDYLNKGGIALKELKESMVNLKLMVYIGLKHEEIRKLLLENEELIKILSTILKNKRL